MVNRQRLAIIFVLVIAISLPAHADHAKDAYKQGLQAERHENYDSAFTSYKQAYTLAPKNATYLAAYTRVRFTVSQQHVHAGQALRNTGALAEALVQFQRAAEIDSSSAIAQQEVRTTTELIKRQERLKASPKVEPPPYKLTDDLEKVVELQPMSTAPITLHMTVNADAAYKTICKLAGINVVIDPEFKAQKITLDLTDVTMREALDMVRLQSKTFWRPVLANTIFVAADTPGKRKDIEQNVMRTFYLRNVTTPAELQEAANLVKQVLDITRVQLLAAQDALIVRGTPDQMLLTEKLLNDIDKPKSEVIIDVAVMQVSRDQLRTLGMNVPTSVSIGFSPTAAAAAATTGGFPIGNFVLSVGGGSFTALASDSKTRFLQNPEIRALNNEKATLRIGDRVPIATGSFQPGIVGGGGVSPLVSTQFQYLDVGVNIDITPHIHSDREVTLKLGLEISSVTGSETIGGITQPIIGQRRIDHEMRLVDGEVNLLGGMLEDSETQSMSGYPWISKIPILKYLFAQENKEHRENEIIFAITPHIVRAKEVTEDNLRQIEIGTGSSIELRHKPTPPAAPENPGNPAKPKQPAPQAPAPPGASSSSTPPVSQPVKAVAAMASGAR